MTNQLLINQQIVVTIASPAGFRKQTTMLHASCSDDSAFSFGLEPRGVQAVIEVAMDEMLGF